MKDQKIHGFEALLRWNHPKKGVLLPENFLPILEELELTIPVGFWLLQTACQQVKHWQEIYQNEVPLTLHVNLSAAQLKYKGLLQVLEAILTESGFPAQELVVEITENLMMDSLGEINDTLQVLRTWGTQIHLDDFGTEYSSLGKLNTLLVDTLKIDRCFIQQMNTQTKEASIVQTILALANSMGLQTIAEGVEHEAQRMHLQEMGCDYWQGFLFSAALPAAELEDCLLRLFPKKPFFEEV